MPRAFALFVISLLWAAPVVPTERVVSYAIEDGRRIADPLGGIAGDPELGRKLYFDRGLTGCSGCHGSPGGPGAQANVQAADAPSLRGIATRMEEGTIRLWLVAPRAIAPESDMPAFYDVGQRTDPNDPRYGEPILTAAEIEHLVAYLMRQK